MQDESSKSPEIPPDKSTEASAAPSGPTDLEKSMAATAGAQISGAVPPSGPMAELIETKPDIMGRESGSWIGQWGQALLNKFLSKHKTDWEQLQAEEREDREVRGMFKFYETALAETKQKLDIFESSLRSFQTVNFPQAVFGQTWAGQKPFTTVLSNPEFLTGFILQKHGDEVLALARGEFEALQKKSLDFRRDKRVTLKKLGLI